MRQVYVIRDGKLVPREDAPPRQGVYLSSDYGTYDCPITGRPIDGRSAHRENLKRNGCRILEKGESDGFRKNRERHVAESTQGLINRMFRE